METYKIGNKVDCIIRSFASGTLGQTEMKYANQPYTIIKNIEASMTFLEQNKKELESVKFEDVKAAEKEFEQKELSESINRFLSSLSEENRDIFVCRYFYSDSIKEIASFFGTSESKIKSSLFRSRKILKKHLEKEGFDL